jgi:hypothetical protein
MIKDNVLYLTVLPLIHFNKFFGLGGATDQAMTLFPSRDLATEFFPEEVDQYIKEFETRAKNYLTGAHVTGYTCEKVATEDGRFIVQVIQNVR